MLRKFKEIFLYFQEGFESVVNIHLCARLATDMSIAFL